MIYITLQEAIDDHVIIIAEYGGLQGVRDIGLLMSALEMPRAAAFGRDLHPTPFDKAAAYLYHIVRNHPFLDGNKRTGTIIALTFLKQNGIHLPFTPEQSLLLEELVVATAEGKISKGKIASFFSDCHK